MNYKLSVILLALFAAPSAFACSTCMVGDPTQSLMGSEKPFENRLRLSLDYLSRSEELGREGFNKKVIDEDRLSLSLAYAPSSRWMISANLPFIKRQLESFNLADQEVSMLGDTTITVKNYLQDSEFLQSDMYGFLAGIKLPTASEQKDENGLALDFDVQAGQGATVVNLGLWYAHFSYPFLLYTSASYHVASEGYQDFQAGDALVFNATAQYASSHGLSYYLGLEGRSSQKDTFAGVSDPDSGGTIIYLVPGIIYTIKPDLLLNLAFNYAAADQLNGEHEESDIISIGLTYDFEIH